MEYGVLKQDNTAVYTAQHTVTQADIDAGLRAKCGGVFLVREDQNFDKFKNYHVHIRDVNQLNYYLD